MKILLTNDDGFEAPGIRAAFGAIAEFGDVHVVAPAQERSACSHSISLYRPIRVHRIAHPFLGMVHAVDGTPADCVRLAVGTLLEDTVDLVVSGINCGANTGVDSFYSGTVAGAREAAMIGLRGIAVSQAVRQGVDIDWPAAAQATTALLRQLIDEELPARGLWSINFPAPIPANALSHVHHVPVAEETVPLEFEKLAQVDGKLEFRYGQSYWERDVSEPSDFSVVRDGGIAVTRIPVFGKF